MNDGTPTLDLALLTTAASRAPSCRDFFPPQGCTLSCMVRYQRLGCNDKLKYSTSSSLSPNLSKSALLAGMLHAVLAAYSLRASQLTRPADDTLCALTSCRHHALGSRHGCVRHDFQYGSSLPPQLSMRFPSSYPTLSTQCAAC